MKPIATRLLVSLLFESEEELRMLLADLQGAVGWVELRLDHMPVGFDLTSVLADYPGLRFVAAILLQEEGGHFMGNASERKALLQEVASAGFEVIDLPLGSGAVELPARVQRLVSWHQSAPKKTAVPLREIYAQARTEAGPKGYVKLVTWADFSEQSMAAVLLQKDSADSTLLAFSQGPGGSASRILSLLAGAPWIYSCWPGANTAPGQWDYQSLLALLPDNAGHSTKVFGIMGNPVEHSLSPFLWHAAFAESPYNAVYLRFPVADAAAFFATAPCCGITALSVTTPWKRAAAEVASNPWDSGAANFLQFQNQQWVAANTDGVGALDALEDAGLPSGSRVLLLGAGGAARGVAMEALQRGYALTVAARRAEQAQQLCAACATDGAPLTAATLKNIKQSDFHAVIQATTVGSFEQPGSPTPGQTPGAGALALDMIYHPLQTAWLRSAEAAGAIPVAGTAMLIRQMLEQLHSATGLEADFAKLNTVLHEELSARAAVLLIGARASGKTSLGRALAAKLGWHFIDADEELERRHQRNIADWIAQDERGFRSAERDLLPELIALPRHVVALGGGVVESPTSVQRLAMASRVVFLDCPIKTLLERQQKEPRPPLCDLPLAEEIDHLLARRLPFYQECADLTLSSADGFAEIVERLFSSPVLKLFPT